VSATQTSVTISWSPSNDDVGVTGYGLYRGSSRVDTTQTSGIFNGLSCGTAYQVGVDAVDAAGNRSQRAELTVTTAACPDSQAPSMPASVAATTRTTTSIALAWLPSDDNVGVVGYGLYRGGTRVDTTSVTNGIFSGLSCGTNYTLAVDAYDAAGNRSQQAVLMVATLACPDTQAPSAPTALAASNVTETSLTLTWAAARDNVGVTGYDVYRNGTKTGSTTTLSSPQSGLTCATSYTFGVVAYDAAGNRSTQAQLTRSTSICTQPPSGASVAVSAGGNDSTCLRGDPSKPCASFQRAMNVAQAGDSITVAGGTYPGQQLTGNKNVTFRVASGQVATFTDRVTLYNLTGVTLVGPFRGNGHSNFDLWFDGCDADVTVDGWTGLALGIVGSANGITLRNMDMGGYSASNAPAGDSGISPNADRCNGGGTIPDDRMVRNVVIEDSRFHDVFYGPESTWAGAHPDCFELEGRTDRITFRRVVFERCGNTFIGIFTDWGPNNNVTIENSLFRNIGPSTWWSMQAGLECNGFVFRYNTYDPNNASAYSAHAAPLITCGGGAQVYGNIFRKGPGPSGEACNGRGQVWSYNVFETAGSACGSNATTVSDAMFVSRGSDYHLLAGSPAINKGDPTRFPSSDADGDSRPLAGMPDAGCDERA
jgi:chitodextrinase